MNRLANKANLTKFLVPKCRSDKLRDKLKDKHIYVASEQSCIHITKDQWEEVAHLQSNQEEAGTIIILHAVNAAGEGYQSVV